MHAQHASARLNRGDGHAYRRGIALRGLFDAAHGTHEPFARDRLHEHVAHGVELAHGALNHDILVDGLVESRTGIDADAIVRDARTLQGAGLVAQEAHDGAHDRRFLGQGEATAHRRQLARLGQTAARVARLQHHRLARRLARTELAVTHDHAATVGLGHHGDHVGVREAAHIVDDGSAQAKAHAGNLGVARVDAHDGAGLCQGAHHGNDALGLVVGVDGVMAGTRGLAAHVDDVRTLVQHLQATRDGGVGVYILSAVGERVGCHIENAHDPRARQRELETPALPC